VKGVSWLGAPREMRVLCIAYSGTAGVYVRLYLAIKAKPANAVEEEFVTISILEAPICCRQGPALTVLRGCRLSCHVSCNDADVSKILSLSGVWKGVP